jgi:bifunctional non-homologous end joining protein LigD
MVPIEPELTWREALRYSEEIAARLAGAAIDCRFNKPRAAAIAAFSPRALPGFPVAAAVEWTALPRLARADAIALG